MKTKEKKEAIFLREQGISIKQIAQKLGVSKASVSVWVRNVVLSENQLKTLSRESFKPLVIEKRRQSRLQNELIKRRGIINQAKSDIKRVSKEELKLIGSMLYWAEGRKRGQRIITFSNSDPLVIGVMMRFFREICDVPEEKFRGHIHTYSHLNALNSEKYWSSITNIPQKQFYKTYVKPSSSSQGKMDSLPYGTFDIDICDTQLFLTVMGWIEKISDLLLK